MVAKSYPAVFLPYSILYKLNGGCSMRKLQFAGMATPCTETVSCNILGVVPSYLLKLTACQKGPWYTSCPCTTASILVTFLIRLLNMYISTIGWSLVFLHASNLTCRLWINYLASIFLWILHIYKPCYLWFFTAWMPIWWKCSIS